MKSSIHHPNHFRLAHPTYLNCKLPEYWRVGWLVAVRACLLVLELINFSNGQQFAAESYCTALWRATTVSRCMQDSRPIWIGFTSLRYFVAAAESRLAASSGRS